MTETMRQMLPEPIHRMYANKKRDEEEACQRERKKNGIKERLQTQLYMAVNKANIIVRLVEKKCDAYLQTNWSILNEIYACSST